MNNRLKVIKDSEKLNLNNINKKAMFKDGKFDIKTTKFIISDENELYVRSDFMGNNNSKILTWNYLGIVKYAGDNVYNNGCFLQRHMSLDIVMKMDDIK